MLNSQGFYIIGKDFFIGLLFLLLGLLTPSSVYAQLNAKYFGDIYNENNVKIELLLIKPRINCGVGSRDWIYKIRAFNVGNIPARTKFLNWKLKTLNCENYVIERIFTIDLSTLIKNTAANQGMSDWSFEAKEIIDGIVDAKLSEVDLSEKDKNLGKFNNLPLPDSIVGNTIVEKEQFTTLKAMGELNDDTRWVWYENACGEGKPIFKGFIFRPKVVKNITYFVRSENQNGFSKCLPVNLKVYDKEINPQKISSADGNNWICPDIKNQFKTLSVTGKLASEDFKWVWYENNLNDTSKIVEGVNSITVTPTATTTYFVRAESSFMISGTVDFTVSVNKLSVRPDAIIPSIAGELCAGQKIELTKKGGSLGDGSEWVWIKNVGVKGFEEIGRGEKITIQPDSTSFVFVYAKGYCSFTEAAVLRIPVLKTSRLPEKSEVLVEVNKKQQRATLTVNGGSLKEGFHWEWFILEPEERVLLKGPKYNFDYNLVKKVNLRFQGGCDFFNKYLTFENFENE